ncbi:ABC transporter permease [Promicromonospora vindobonensis]|uniref:Transport permease protein n=1 Tax=Promicromonospora vindobonensis TaxID=195748 RepID=A0ABW5VXD4_9MICO
MSRSARVARHPLADSMTMTGRSFRHALRSVDSLLLSVLLPLMLLVLMTVAFGGAMNTGDESYIDYVTPSIILLCAGYGATMTATSVTKDMTEGIVDRFRTMRVVSSAVLTGHVVVSVLRNLLSTVIVIAAAFALGFRAQASPAEWLGAFGLLTLFILALTWLAAAIGLFARSVDTASALGFFILFLPYVSSAFAPVETMPRWVQGFAEHQPITPVVNTVRGLLLDTPVDDYWWTAVAWCLAILTVSAVGSAVLWRQSRAR